MSRRRRRFQPRIRGVQRLPKPAGLLPSVEAGLQDIATMEGKSLSWVIAEIVSAYFELDAATGKPLTERLGRPRMRNPSKRASLR